MNFKYYAIAFCPLFLFLGWQTIHASQKLVGKQAPSFKGQAVFPDGTVQDFDLENYEGQNIVLYFYPMDNTPGCTKQAKIFRDNIKKMNAQGIMIVGISYDSIKSHKAFQDKHSLPFPLVSDSKNKHAISKKYKASGLITSKRKTFLINKKGIIFKVFDKVDIQDQIEDILECFAQQK